jgi:triphosphoribosyl-dephospho-CoA synthetase
MTDEVIELLLLRRTSSEYGPSRHFAALQKFDRFLSEADINSGGS